MTWPDAETIPRRDAQGFDSLFSFKYREITAWGQACGPAPAPPAARGMLGDVVLSRPVQGISARVGAGAGAGAGLGPGPGNLM